MGAGKALIKAAEQGASAVLSKKEMRAQLKAAKAAAKANKKAEGSFSALSREKQDAIIRQQGQVTPKQARQLGYSGREIRENLPNQKRAADVNQRASDQNLHKNIQEDIQKLERTKRDAKRAAKAEAKTRLKANQPVKQSPPEPKAPVQRSKPAGSVYNPDNTPSTPPGGFKLPNKHLDDLKPKTGTPSPSTTKTMETGAGKGGPAPESAPAAEEKKGGWWSTIKGLYKGAQSAPNEFQKGTSEMVGKISGGKFKAADAGIEEGEHWWSSNAKNHMLERTNRERSNLYSQMQGAKTQEELNKVMEDAGIKYKAGMSAEEVGKNIDAKYMSQLQSGPTYGDYFHGNHGAGVLAFGMTGAGVLALSDSRGKRSNSDLYSNPF